MHILDLSNPIINPVTTEHGLIPETDLAVTVEQADDGISYIMKRTYVYKGSARPDLWDKVVRQDVWITMKTGIKSGVKSGI